MKLPGLSEYESQRLMDLQMEYNLRISQRLYALDEKSLELLERLAKKNRPNIKNDDGLHENTK